MGSVVGVGALIFDDVKTLIGLAAGSAWTLCIFLLIANSRERNRISELKKDVEVLKTELANARRQADHWSSTAENVSQSVLTVLQMGSTGAANPPPRRRPRNPAQAAAINVGAIGDDGVGEE
nr:hypothetical protein [Aureimonas sp. AU4]